jgi:ABC-2 type transport system permease protein
VSARTFLALLSRDVRVARRNLLPLLLQTLLQPLLLVFVFGRVLTSSGLVTGEYKSMLLPGVIALSMLLAGIQSVAMPLISEFQFTREIEDRLLAPIEIEWVAVEKLLAGMAQALIAGLVVLPAAWLLLGPDVGLSLGHPIELASILLLVALLASAVGLLLGCSIGQAQIGLMFTLVLAPMIFFGCTYYPWSALSAFPALQKIVLVNPIVYASEGLRAILAPQLPHLPTAAIFAALAAFDALFLTLGLRQFRRKAVS